MQDQNGQDQNGQDQNGQDRKRQAPVWHPQHSQKLDLSGLKCPLPVLRTQKALAGMKAGDQVEVITTDPMSVIDLPHFCNEHGHQMLSNEALEPGKMRFLIAKG